MRRFTFLVVAAAAGLLFAACSGGTGSGADRPVRSTSSTTTTFALPRVDPPATIVVQEALPEAVPVEDEDLDYPDDLAAGLPRRDILVALPADFTDRQDLLLCSWVSDVGWSGCTSTSAASGSPVPVQVAQGAPDAEVHVVLQLETVDETGMTPIRRLAVYPYEQVFTYDYRLLDNYETVADVVTMQPFLAGNYLEPIF